MKIQEITLFGYVTKGEALEIANATIENTCVAAINIMRGLKPAEQNVCYIVIPLDRPLILEGTRTDRELLDFMMKNWETQQFAETFSTEPLTRESLNKFMEEYPRPE